MQCQRFLRENLVPAQAEGREGEGREGKEERRRLGRREAKEGERKVLRKRKGPMSISRARRKERGAKRGKLR